MGDYKELVRIAVKKFNDARNYKNELKLKGEQEMAVQELLAGHHVLAVLPTGYGKSTIFTMFLLATEEIRELCATQGNHLPSSVLIISPLRSIIEDQITEMRSMGVSAVELSSNNVEQVVRSSPQFIYASGESVIEKAFLNGLKNSRSAIHQSLSLIVVDESHTIETWTGKR